MAVFRTSPRYEQPLIQGVNTTTPWWRWFQAVDSGVPPSTEVPVTPMPSPFTYSAPARGFLIVKGGTTSVMFSRTPNVFYDMVQLQGPFPMSQNDQLQMTYTGALSLTWIPQ